MEINTLDPERIMQLEQADFKSRHYHFFLAVRILFTSVLVALVFYYVKLEDVIQVLSGANLWIILPIIALRLSFYIVRGLKIWQILRLGVGSTIPLLSTIGWFSVSCCIGVFTPGGIGDFSLAYFTKRFNIGISEGIASVFLDKLINVFIMTLIAVMGAILYFRFNPSALIICSSAAIVLVWLASHLGFDRLSIVRSFREKYRQFLPGFRVLTEFFWGHPWAFLLNVLLALVQSFVVALQVWFSLLLVHSHVHFAGVFWLSGISRLANGIPFTVSGLGVYEASIVYLMKILGSPAEYTLAGILVTRSMTWIMSAFVICWVLWSRRSSTCTTDHLKTLGKMPL